MTLIVTLTEEKRRTVRLYHQGASATTERTRTQTRHKESAESKEMSAWNIETTLEGIKDLKLAFERNDNSAERLVSFFKPKETSNIDTMSIVARNGQTYQAFQHDSYNISKNYSPHCLTCNNLVNYYYNYQWISTTDQVKINRLVTFQNIPNQRQSNFRPCSFTHGMFSALFVYNLLRNMNASKLRRMSKEGKGRFMEFLVTSSSILSTKNEISLNCFENRSISPSTSNVVYRYYVVISREFGYNSTSKMFTSEVFEEALRECGIGPLQITYTIIFPDDCRMFLLVPVYIGGYIHKLDQKNRPELTRIISPQNEINRWAFTHYTTVLLSGEVSLNEYFPTANSLI